MNTVMSVRTSFSQAARYFLGQYLEFYLSDRIVIGVIR